MWLIPATDQLKMMPGTSLQQKRQKTLLRIDLPQQEIKDNMIKSVIENLLMLAKWIQNLRE